MTNNLEKPTSKKMKGRVSNCDLGRGWGGGAVERGVSIVP